jgi:hypothetical protein
LGGRLVLINSSITNVPLYMLSMYKAPKAVIGNIDIYRKDYYGKVAIVKKSFGRLGFSLFT